MKINEDLIIKQTFNGNETNYAPSIKLVKDTFDKQSFPIGYTNGGNLNLNDYITNYYLTIDVDTILVNGPSDYPLRTLANLWTMANGNNAIQFLFAANGKMWYRLRQWRNWGVWIRVMDGQTLYGTTNITEGYKGLYETAQTYNLKSAFTCYMVVINKVGASNITGTCSCIVCTGAFNSGNYGKITWLTGDKPDWVTTFTLDNYNPSIGGYQLSILVNTYYSMTISRIY